MEPHHFFTAQRVLIVAGKGGVGKSAVAASLALTSARSGLRTLFVSLDAQSIEVPSHDLLECVTVTPGRALTDYLASKGMGLLSRQLSRSGIVELVATTAPGLDDLLVLGRIKAFEQELRADVIIVDGPAAGHAIDLVQAPIQLKRAISTGPIGSQADEVLTMLSSSNRCKLLMVTTPAMTPVAETAEAIQKVRNSVGITLAPIFVNKCDDRVPEIPVPSEPYLADAYDFSRMRYEAQRDAIASLSEELTIPQVHLSRFLFEGAELVENLSREIEDQLKALS
jgi:anion-transporting  ArsA/GET3 family ATPase